MRLRFFAADVTARGLARLKTIAPGRKEAEIAQAVVMAEHERKASDIEMFQPFLHARSQERIDPEPR